MRVRKLEHLDVLAGHLPSPGPHPAWFANGEFADGEEALGADDAQECAVAATRVSVSFDLPVGAEGAPSQPFCLVVPCTGGLLWTTLPDLRGGPRHFVSPAPPFWSWSNRRMAYRVPLGQPSHAEKGGETLPAVLVDVSIGGGLVRLPLPEDDVECGTRLRISLPLAGEPWVDAEVVRVEATRDAECTCGVRWLDLPTNIDQRLANFVFTHERASAKGTKSR